MIQRSLFWTPNTVQLPLSQMTPENDLGLSLCLWSALLYLNMDPGLSPLLPPAESYACPVTPLKSPSLNQEDFTHQSALRHGWQFPWDCFSDQAFSSKEKWIGRLGLSCLRVFHRVLVYSPLFSILYSLYFHCNSDNIQFYIWNTSIPVTSPTLPKSVSGIKSWTQSYFLKLNIDQSD